MASSSTVFGGTHHVTGLRLFSDASQIQESDWDAILITVKTYDTQSAVDACRRLVGPQTWLISIQNGHGNLEAMAAAFGADRILGARIITGAEMKPGHVTITVHADALRLGPHHGEADLMPAARRWAAILDSAGVPTQASDQFLPYLWAKLLYNCALNPMGALLRLTYGELWEHPPCRQAMSDIFREAFAVCQAHGIPLFWQRPEDYEKVFDTELVPKTRNHYPSMLRDLEHRGRTEIDSMNGAVVELGKQHGIVTPVNAVLTAMIKRKEKAVSSALAGGKH
ncbi:MAG: putative 2-dehydropantoate 2-reductase [Gemmatales bacterium]|nr:MAG: putative 2-dehydropantoate 2-reductase [Gemmatales bacterium]